MSTEEVTCKCGVTAEMKTCAGLNNPAHEGKLYHVCPSGTCGFFRWANQTPNKRQRTNSTEDKDNMSTECHALLLKILQNSETILEQLK